jgi:hypothetical protein
MLKFENEGWREVEERSEVPSKAACTLLFKFWFLLDTEDDEGGFDVKLITMQICTQGY